MSFNVTKASEMYEYRLKKYPFVVFSQTSKFFLKNTNVRIKVFSSRLLTDFYSFILSILYYTSSIEHANLIILSLENCSFLTFIVLKFLLFLVSP